MHTHKKKKTPHTHHTIQHSLGNSLPSGCPGYHHKSSSCIFCTHLSPSGQCRSFIKEQSDAHTQNYTENNANLSVEIWSDLKKVNVCFNMNSHSNESSVKDISTMVIIFGFCLTNSASIPPSPPPKISTSFPA